VAGQWWQLYILLGSCPLIHPRKAATYPCGYIVDNEQGLIVERTLALRPYPALKLFLDAVYASLKDMLPPDVWDYPTP
jgi:hypothetical protein